MHGLDPKAGARVGSASCSVASWAPLDIDIDIGLGSLTVGQEGLRPELVPGVGDLGYLGKQVGFG